MDIEERRVLTYKGGSWLTIAIMLMYVNASVFTPSGHSDEAGGLSFWRCVTLNVIQSPITKIEISIIINKSKYREGNAVMRPHEEAFRYLLCSCVMYPTGIHYS